MTQKRLTLSLVALMGSVLLFVIASFAWFAISDVLNINDNTIELINIDVDADLYVSDNGSDYVLASSIEFLNNVPGDIKYYKIVLTNNNDFAIHTQVSLHGFTDSYADAGGDTSNYALGQTLMDVVLLNASNNIDSVTITDQTLTSLYYGSALVITHEDVLVPALGGAEFYFSFTISEDAGNDYQNLGLDIAHIFVQSVE